MNINNINEAFSRIVKEEFDNQTDANKTVIYKENGVYKTTSKANYDAQIQDARKIQTLYDFESAREIMDYYNKYFNTTDDDFIILDECTNSLKEAPEKKERAPRRPKNVCGSLENEVEMRLADELFTSFQKTPSWPFGPGYYDIENEMGVAREDGENGFRVFTVTTPVAKNRLGRAKEIAKEYGLKTEYVGPNNTIGKSNEMLKIYIPMDVPSPFDEKRMKDWEEKTKAFKSDRKSLKESLDSFDYDESSEADKLNEEITKLYSPRELYYNPEMPRMLLTPSYIESALSRLNKSDTAEYGLQLIHTYMKELIDYKQNIDNFNEFWLKRYPHALKYADSLLKLIPEDIKDKATNISNIKESFRKPTYVSYDNIMNPSSDIKWKNGQQLTEAVDTVTRYKVEYYAGDNDERLETYIYADSIEEVRKQLVAKTKSEGIDYVMITAMIPETVPTSYRENDLNEDKGQPRSKRYTTYFNRIKRAIENGDEETLKRTKEAIMYAPAKELKNSEASELMDMIKNRKINEASYGGAFDIEDDQYFTRDDLVEFAEDVVERLNTTSYSKCNYREELSDKNEKLEENLEGNLTSDLYNAVADVLFKYKDYFDDKNSLKIYIKETVPYLVDKFFVENPNFEEDHIISEDTVKRNGKWVNKGKDGTHGTFKTKKAADAQRKAMFANGYKESKSIKESVSHSFSIGDTFKNVDKTFIVDDIKGDYTLVHSDELKFMPYIVAWKLSDDGSWGQGHYFKTREEAEEYLSKE